MTRQLLFFLGGALLGTMYGLWFRGYPPLLAAILGAAIGSLLWAIRRTLDQLRGSDS